MSFVPVAARARTCALAGALVASTAFAGCTPTMSSDDPAQAAAAPRKGPSSTPTPVSQADISANVSDGETGVRVDKVIRTQVADGAFTDVRLTTKHGRTVPGEMSSDKTSWSSTQRLESGTRYRLVSVAKDGDGLVNKLREKFRADDLTLDEQTYASVSPLDGQTVGVGFPVTIHFDIPVHKRARFERHMSVTSSAGQKGGFYWLDSQTVHYRPKHFWKPGSTIKVKLDINSLAAGDGIFGQEDREATFHVSDRAMISKVNMDTHKMKVYENGRLINTFPITTGVQPLHTTRSGIKVITEKYRSKTMNSETVGIDPNSADGYNIDNVEYAMRVTNSGEFVHAAPWSVGSQGYANVSHGCTGMSTSDAGWLYNRSIVGDVVEYTGSDRPMELTNGFGDWNMDWHDWRAGSALH